MTGEQGSAPGAAGPVRDAAPAAPVPDATSTGPVRGAARRGGRWPWASAIVTAVIVGALFLPGSAVPKVGFDGIDLMAHLVLFGAWAAAVSIEFDRLSPPVVVGSGLVLALATEGVQSVIPGRSASAQDLVADTLGLVVGAALVALARLLRARRAS